MKETVKTYGKTTKYLREFKGLDEFYSYITTNPLNETFQLKRKTLASVDGSEHFTGTKSYDEAVELFKNGQPDMAEKINTKLKVIKNQVVNDTVKKVMFDVVGFQASVPRYLQGIPTNMVNKKVVPVKQKVITLNKDISYNCGIKAEEIINASIQTLQLIKLIEAQGIRVNLNIIWGCKGSSTNEVVKIRLKSANERLNISKLAFPLVNPSMLRRLCFRYLETAPTVTSDYTWGYGKALDGSELKQYCKDEYVLPRLFDGDITKLGDLNTICNLTDKIINGEEDKPKL